LSTAAETQTWSVYLVRRADGALYTGIATDVERRLEEHRTGTGARALRGRGPLVLAASVCVGERADALRVEHWIKQLSKPEKEVLTRAPELLRELVAAVSEARCPSDRT